MDNKAPLILTTWPDELLDEVLQKLLHHPQRSVSIDSRSSLSVESFQPSDTPSPEDSRVLADFKCCRKFARVALKRQFARIDTRFELASFQRLQEIANQPHLAREVLKFSYKVPIFYPEGARFQQYLSRTRHAIRDVELKLQTVLTNGVTESFSKLRPDEDQLRARLGRLMDEESQINCTMIRAENQSKMKVDKYDVQVLHNALTAFTSLRQIRLMRVQDQVDAGWEVYLRRHHDVAQIFRPVEWTLARDHAMRTLGRAYMTSRSPATRFSSRFMDAQIPLPLTHGSKATLSGFAEKLTSLELQFHDPTNIDEKMLQLSPLFRTLFTAATGMQAVHIEFNGREVSIPLESIFHNVQWNNINVIGVGFWRLTSDEIISLVRRHRTTLKGLRLRGVLLKDGSRWDTVLRVLRLEMAKLQWVSLKKSNYAAWKDRSQSGFVGILVDSDTDGESDWEDEVEVDEPLLNEETEASSEVDEVGDEEGLVAEDDDSVVDSDAADSDTGSPTYAPSINHENIPGQPSTALLCYCRDRPESTQDLGDNGVQREHGQRKFWEQWVIGKCNIHGRPAP